MNPIIKCQNCDPIAGGGGGEHSLKITEHLLASEKDICFAVFYERLSFHLCDKRPVISCEPLSIVNTSLGTML